MRCPKCGYISFDHQETCKKCYKHIGDTVTEINGTVCDALAPSFLQLEAKDHFSAQTSRPKITDQNPTMVASEPHVGMMEGIDSYQGVEEISFADDSKELVMDLDDFDEVSLQDEFSLDLKEERGGLEKSLPPLDFGDLDISDLAPPNKEQASQQFEEELQLVSKEPVAELSEKSPEQQKISTTKATGLEDLHVKGLNLDSPVKFVAGGTTKLPSVKTGTALDKFDVDLGELFSQNKK